MIEKGTPRIWSGDPIDVDHWGWNRTRWIPERTLSAGDVFIIGSGNEPSMNPKWVDDIEICNKLGDSGFSEEFFVRAAVIVGCLAGIIAIIIGCDENTSGAIAFPFACCVCGLGLACSE